MHNSTKQYYDFYELENQNASSAYWGCEFRSFKRNARSLILLADTDCYYLIHLLFFVGQFAFPVYICSF